MAGFYLQDTFTYPYQPSAISKKVIARVRRTGSIIDDSDDEEDDST